VDFTLTEAQLELASRVRKFVQSHCSAEIGARLDDGTADARELYRALGREGILAVPLPREYGGLGGGLTEVAIVNEELARGNGTAVNLFCVNAVFAGLNIAQNGSEAQKNRWLPAIARGEAMAAFALTEPHAGSDAAKIRMSARRTAEGDFVLDGTKMFTTGAAQADVIIAVLRTRPDGPAKEGTSVILVPAGTPGVEIRPLPKLAGNAYSSCEVRFDGTRVPADQVLGGPDAVDTGWMQLLSGVDLERLCVAASSLGLAEAVYEVSANYARTREAFGQPIAKFQAIQHLLVDMATEIEAMRWLVFHAAWLRDRGEISFREVCMAKLFCSERAVEIASRGMKVFGGYAYLGEYPVQRMLRESFLSIYAGGTSEIMKNTIGRLLGL